MNAAIDLMADIRGLIVALIFVVLMLLVAWYAFIRISEARRYEQHKRNFDEHYHTHTSRKFH